MHTIYSEMYLLCSTLLLFARYELAHLCFSSLICSLLHLTMDEGRIGRDWKTDLHRNCIE